MADVISAQFAEAPTTPVYALLRNSEGKIWNGSAFVTYATVDYDDYPLVMTEQGSDSRHYTVAFPAVDRGRYNVVVLTQDSATPATYSEANDTPVGSERYDWGGDAAIVFPDNFDLLSINADGRVSILTGVIRGEAINNFEFFMASSADHVTGKTGLTVTATRSIDGAAFAACANAVSEVGGGVYKINIATTDLDGVTVLLKFTAPDADTRIIEIITTP